ncbi:MAG TPA: cell wall metabolism sensor histidine kinase WalK [Armatimonadetes bacterium]|jgi:signal transduction histidine kinase|nr:cell wall metabolism sensor histidine kinase WalK [Armatimonadota bacterium]
MFRSFRTQLVVSFFLVILVTPLLFISLFYGPFGRYLRSGNTGSSLPYHARVIGNLLQEVLATGTSVDDLDHLLRMAAKGTPYRFVLIDRDRQVMVDTGVAPGSALPTNPARAAEYGRPLAPDGRPAMHRDGRLLRAAASIDVEGEHIGVLLVSRYSQRPSYFSPSTFIPRIILGLVIAGILGLALSRRLLRPVDALTRAAEAMAGGDLSQRVTVPPHSELGRLSERFNHMADRIEELVSRLSGEHERLQMAHARLAESERRQRELIADVSHELRTPLAVIRSSVDALVDGVADDGERQRRCLRAIEEETTALSRLVEDLLTLSRIDSGQLPMRHEPVSVAALFERSIHRFLPEAEAHGIVLESSLAEGLFFMGDEERMAQVLGNLLDNAIRHTPAGGRVRLEAAREAERIRIRVSDTGCGIAPEHLPRLFDRLYRAERSRCKGSGGSGLGLAIVHEIVDAHGGTVEAESEPDKGMSVTIYLADGAALGFRDKEMDGAGRPHARS